MIFWIRVFGVEYEMLQRIEEISWKLFPAIDISTSVYWDKYGNNAPHVVCAYIHAYI